MSLPVTSADDLLFTDNITTSQSRAMTGIRTSLWFSATRCVLVYMAAPLIAGTLGLSGWLAVTVFALALQLIAAMIAARSAQQLWRSGHRWRLLYLGIAAAVGVITVGSWGELALMGLTQ